MTPRTAFHPGQSWPDDNGIHLNAHGAGLLEHAGVCYLFGEANRGWIYILMKLASWKSLGGRGARCRTTA